MKKRIGYLGIALLIGLSGCSESTTVEVESSATESVVEETTLEESLEETTAMVERTTIESSSKDLQDEMLSEYAREKYKGECITFDYREYFRYEDEYKGTQVYLVAQVDQILDGKEFRCYSSE